MPRGDKERQGKTGKAGSECSPDKTRPCNCLKEREKAGRCGKKRPHNRRRNLSRGQNTDSECALSSERIIPLYLGIEGNNLPALLAQKLIRWKIASFWNRLVSAPFLVLGFVCGVCIPKLGWLFVILRETR